MVFLFERRKKEAKTIILFLSTLFSPWFSFFYPSSWSLSQIVWTDWLLQFKLVSQKSYRTMFLPKLLSFYPYDKAIQKVIIGEEKGRDCIADRSSYWPDAGVAVTISLVLGCIVFGSPQKLTLKELLQDFGTLQTMCSAQGKMS